MSVRGRKVPGNGLDRQTPDPRPVSRVCQYHPSMKSVLIVALAAVISVCPACGNDSPDTPTPDAASSTANSGSPENFLDTLNSHGIKLRASFTETGYRDDDQTIKYGQGLCDLGRRKGPQYNPVPVIQADDKMLSEESARIVYKAALDNLCPDVAAFDPSLAPHPTADTIPGNGQFPVGGSVRPGTYISQPAMAGQVCVWGRNRDMGGSPGSTIAEGVESAPITVTILPTDGAFTSVNCQDWRRVG